MGFSFSCHQRPSPPAHRLHDVNGDAEFHRIVSDAQNANLLLVSDFHATWCRPCLQCAPTLNSWALNDYKTSVVFVKIDVDQHGELANQFSISVLPTFVLFKHGKEISRVTGADLGELRKAIEKFV